jgi:uncharacterized protein YjlB
MVEAIIQGSSTLLLGVGPNEDERNGQEVIVNAGDVIILPAGVAHCSKHFQDEYRYVGAYPIVSQACVCFEHGLIELGLAEVDK